MYHDKEYTRTDKGSRPLSDGNETQKCRKPGTRGERHDQEPGERDMTRNQGRET